MATLHISASDAARDFASLLARVRSGAEIMIEDGTQAIAVLRSPDLQRRTIEDCVALLPAGSTATIDEDFARDLMSSIEANREPLRPPQWD